MKTVTTLIAAGCIVGMALVQQTAPPSLASSETPPESEQTATVYGTLLLAGTAAVQTLEAAQTTSPPPAKYPVLPSETPLRVVAFGMRICV